jgi:hypothetical protein
VASKPKPRRKGYDEGGSVQPAGSVGSGIASAMKGGLMLAQLAKMYGGAGGAGGALGGADALARGGKIKRVAGKPIGKDDGLKKLGERALNTINKGRLPGKGAR